MSQAGSSGRWRTSRRCSNGGRRYEAIFSTGRAEFRRRDGELDTHVEIAVSPEDDIELRRISITNIGRTERTIGLPATPRSCWPPADIATRRSAISLYRRSSCRRAQRFCVPAGRARGEAAVDAAPYDGARDASGPDFL